MRALLFSLLLIGCGSDEATPTTTTDSGTAADTSSTVDTSTTSDTGSKTDATGEAPACPSSIPKTGDACSSEGQKCDYPVDCGPTAGDFATCTAGKWSVVHNPCTTGDTGPG